MALPPSKPKTTSPAEYGIRFGCGSLLGAVVGVFLALEVAAEDMTRFAGSVALIALVCGAMAAWQGDRFWNFD